MSLPEITYCPGTLAAGYDTYSWTCLRRMFQGRKVHHILPYEAPTSSTETDELYIENRKRISISGVQEKFSLLLEKNKLRLIEEGEHGTYILKPIPYVGNSLDQMPANEHLTMQIARQVFGIETAENALILFRNGAPAYLTKRFDVQEGGGKWAAEDFASLAGRSPHTHGEHYKYQGSYWELFELMKKHLPAYQVEAPILFRLLVFNYLFSNGDAHFKNFSILETPVGDYRMSPAYDLLNTHMHIHDTVFALEEGLLPKKLSKGTIMAQFLVLADQTELHQGQRDTLFAALLSNSEKVAQLVEASYLSASAKRNYLQAYQTRFNKLNRG